MFISYAATMEMEHDSLRKEGRLPTLRSNYLSICDSCHMQDIVLNQDEDLRGPYLGTSFQSQCVLSAPTASMKTSGRIQLILDLLNQLDTVIPPLNSIREDQQTDSI